MGQLAELFDPDTGGPEDLHRRPTPEGVLLFMAEVSATSGVGLLRPHLGDGRAARRHPPQRPPGCDECVPGSGGAGGIQGGAVSRRRWFTVRTSTGRIGSRSRVRLSMRALRCRWSLRRLISSLPDR